MNRFKSLIAVFVIVLFGATGCAVVMATRGGGVSLEELSKCRTRSCVMSKEVALVDSKKDDQGNLIETYRVQKPRQSATRAIMHGLLDVSTFGLWEIVGTPIEAVKGKKEFYVITVHYDAEEKIQRVTFE